MELKGILVKAMVQLMTITRVYKNFKKQFMVILANF